jgi:hypothetical protein
VKAKLRRGASAKVDHPPLIPAPVTTADRIMLEIRKFIAAAIFFNAQAAEKIGLGLTDMQMMHMLLLYGSSRPTHLAARTGLSSGGSRLRSIVSRRPATSAANPTLQTAGACSSH